MGIISLNCLTTDPDSTTFYGLSKTNTYDARGYSYPDNSFVTVLVKSNSSPVSPYNLTWSVVSRIGSRYLQGGMSTYNEFFTCAINSQGVFTAFRDGYGIRYDPAGTMDPSFGFKGPGAWMNVSVDSAYNWTAGTGVSGYVNNGATSVLLHSFYSSDSNTIRVATMDEATKRLLPAGVWPMPSSSEKSSLYTIADPNTAVTVGPPVKNFTKELYDMDFFTPIGGGPGQVSFVLTQKYKSMYAFGIDYTGWIFADEVSKIKVNDTVGTDPNPTPTPSSSDSGSSDSTGVIIGVLAGVLFLGGILVYFLKKISKNTQSDNKPAVPKPNPVLTQGNNYAYAQQPGYLGQNGGPNYYNPAGQYPATTYPLGQPAPTTILPMAPITPVPQHQTFQQQMQGLQFSSHPRPNFVTTAYGGEPDPATAPSNVPAPYTSTTGAAWQPTPWQPTPFVPPARPASTVGVPSSIAGHSPSATAYSSVTAQSSNDPQAIVSHGVDPGKPLPSPPSIPRNSRPSPEVNSPHTPVNTQSPQYVDNAHQQ
ncbi:hypothetical protein BGX23_011743 [Mortierella sp. AD031]|nr:hypothetical protein BGX23_011743 [Mortierella sp. AD031]